MAAPPPSAARASCLSMSGLTLLQITKHCQESMPDIASGVVLGMERAGVLEVTHSFPTPDTGKSDARNTDGDSELPSSSKAADKVDVPKYTMDMLKQLRDGAIRIKTGLERITEHGVVFDDSEEVVEVDCIVLCTGWIFGFEFIDKQVWPEKCGPSEQWKPDNE